MKIHRKHKKKNKKKTDEIGWAKYVEEQTRGKKKKKSSFNH